MELILETQMFERFIEDRTKASNNGLFESRVRWRATTMQNVGEKASGGYCHSASPKKKGYGLLALEFILMLSSSRSTLHSFFQRQAWYVEIRLSIRKGKRQKRVGVKSGHPYQTWRQNKSQKLEPSIVCFDSVGLVIL